MRQQPTYWPPGPWLPPADPSSEYVNLVEYRRLLGRLEAAGTSAADDEMMLASGMVTGGAHALRARSFPAAAAGRQSGPFARQTCCLWWTMHGLC